MPDVAPTPKLPTPHRASPAAADDGQPLVAAALVAAARDHARAAIEGTQRPDGEDSYAHASAVAAMLAQAGAPDSLAAAAYLSEMTRGHDELLASLAPRYGSAVASLVEGAHRLEQLEDRARAAPAPSNDGPHARLRRMLLAFSSDLRGVLLHLASRLQTMRWHAQRGMAYPVDAAREAMELLAPLANRLGVWSLKWELEDLAFRFIDPQAYQSVVRALDATRVAQAREVERMRERVADDLARAGIGAVVQGRAKHLYSIWRKMQGKHLAFDQVLDVRALRVIVGSVDDCYAALARLHARWRAVVGEFDDYIARPKSNGYQSLHSVVLDDDGRAVEVQIRTQAMNDHAEQGVAAHWAYKEAGARGYAGAKADATDARRIAQARKTMLHQLLAWERDVGQGDASAAPSERVYVFTPQGAVIDLPAGATAIDFAYAVHTTLGHRCRGAKVDGALVALHTPLANGQTVEITAAKEGGPSMDWLNPELGFLASPRSRAKARAWFNAQSHEVTVAQGRERLDKLLQRLGRTAAKHAEIAAGVGLADAEALYTVMGKDELPLRDIEALWTPAEPVVDDDASIARRLNEAATAPRAASRGDVLVVGLGDLMTALARCCRPAPPDAIGGFVTRHKGVAIHRESCTNFRHMVQRSPQRVIAVGWGHAGGDARFAVDVAVEASDRSGLLRDISEVFAKERLNVTGVQSQTVRDARSGASQAGGTAHMNFTVEVTSAQAVDAVLVQITKVAGVRRARRR